MNGNRCSLRGQISSSNARQRRSLSTNRRDFARTSCSRLGGSEPFYETSQEAQFAVIFFTQNHHAFQVGRKLYLSSCESSTAEVIEAAISVRLPPKTNSSFRMRIASLGQLSLKEGGMNEVGPSLSGQTFTFLRNGITSN
jgi:hypothetical protein